MARWIESKEALLLAIKHGEDIVEEYQLYLDQDINSIVDWDEDEEPLDFQEWLIYFKEEMDWQSSSEFKNELQRLSEKD